MKKTSSILLLIFFVLTLLSYASVMISPEALKISGFISLLIPLFLIINAILFILFLVRASRKMIMPLLALIIGYKFLFITFSLSGDKKENGDFSVLSYNVRWLVSTEPGGGFESAVDWISADDSHIKCFQEFNSRKDIIRRIGHNGEYDVVSAGRNRTLAIFSKYKIVDSGILLPQDNINNIIFADVLIDGDTVRVYNVHLRSMGITINDITSTEEIRSEYDEAKTKFLKASVERAVQIGVLFEHLENCNYPMIITGDFNDVPYSYNHFKFRRKFRNAFETAGRGFGFTYNGNLPFLRIDHQFYNDRIKVHDYQTKSGTYYSDHFPIKGEYSVLE